MFLTLPGRCSLFHPADVLGSFSFQAADVEGLEEDGEEAHLVMEEGKEYLFSNVFFPIFKMLGKIKEKS